MEHLTGVRYNTSENNIFKWRNILYLMRNETKILSFKILTVNAMLTFRSIIICNTMCVGVEMETIESYLS